MNDVTNIFKHRLKKLRGGENQATVAKELGISRASLSYYENGERKPDINVLYTIASYFDVSTDYLLGLSDTPTTNIQDKYLSDTLGLTQRSIEWLKIITKTSKSKNADSLGKEEVRYRSLLLKSVNELLGGTSDIIDNITYYWYLHFTHFKNFYNDEPYNPISDLELYDSHLNVSFSEDHDFISKVFLLNIEQELTAIREKHLHYKFDNESLKERTKPPSN